MKTNWLTWFFALVLFSVGRAQDAGSNHLSKVLGILDEAALKGKSQAEQGNAESQYFMGGFSELHSDWPDAYRWYERSAVQGNTDAQMSLGNMFTQGRGVAQDFVEAYKWFNIASTSTNGPLTNGIVFTHELTAEQKKSVAFLFETTADKARKARTEVAQRMTPEQIAEGQRLSRQFRPHKEGVASSSDTPLASGTGFFITDDGYLITNSHLVKDAAEVRLLVSKGLIDAKVVQADSANDLALLKAEGGFSSLPITSSRTVELGGMVATVGFPNIGLQGFAPKFARGELASLSGAGDDVRYFQISVPVQPGNSGGPLVDEHGNVVGVVSAKLNARAALALSGSLPENVNYAVKSSFLLSFLESVPDIDAKLKSAITSNRKFEDVVKSAQSAAVLVLVY
jgi:S1-C subfamily serine protease